MRIWSVHLSVCLSVKRVHCDKMEERSVQISIQYDRLFNVPGSFLKRRMVGGGNALYLKFGSTGPHWSEIADFEPIFARSASAITSSEKVQLTLIGSPMHAFQ